MHVEEASEIIWPDPLILQMRELKLKTDERNAPERDGVAGFLALGPALFPQHCLRFVFYHNNAIFILKKRGSISLIFHARIMRVIVKQ